VYCAAGQAWAAMTSRVAFHSLRELDLAFRVRKLAALAFLFVAACVLFFVSAIKCGVYKLRTNIVLDDVLVAEAMSLVQARTKKEVVDRALRELVARQRQRALRSLVGRDLIASDYDVGMVREGMKRDAG